MAEGGAADLDIQRSDIATLLKTPLRKGDTWYLVDSRWFKQWKKYVGFDSWDKYQMGDQNVYPGPIDNSGLLKDGDAQSLKEHLIDELDYILLPTEGWNKLVSWYTLMEGQEPIARKYMGFPLLQSHLLRSTGSGRAGSAAMAHGRSHSSACGISLDRGMNPCPLHQQADCQPLRHQGSPSFEFY
ncbi:ubiquitin carboxyl-terminal hydrolase 15 isoform X8 [Orcinus orca]|uniref:ubiquitin carboxyl-terminal hydrolase 15 isoform X8 n=1 Tax=Orcinus orca TaxID=9733 RepID=UPI001441F4D8|nr:ubiquitin carboxyl-terminal hydrolase 15 isoform X8 [Orcinus orca]